MERVDGLVSSRNDFLRVDAACVLLSILDALGQGEGLICAFQETLC